MNFKRIFYSGLCYLLTVGLVNMMQVKSAHAAMISTMQAVDVAAEAQNRTKVEEFMKRVDVRSQLVELGMEPRSGPSPGLAVTCRDA